MMRKTTCALAFACVTLASSATAQADSWQHKWYWGAQGGLMRFQTPSQASWQYAYIAGGHWLITGGRSALYFAYDQVIFKDSTRSAVIDNSSLNGFREVMFDMGRRIQAQLLIMPTDGYIQFFLGGGFGINQVTNALPEGAFNTSAEYESVLRTIDLTSTKAFPVATGGLQIRFGPLALFGQAQYMPTGRGFLISSSQYAFVGGFRYALTGSREEVTAGR